MKYDGPELDGSLVVAVRKWGVLVKGTLQVLIRRSSDGPGHIVSRVTNAPAITICRVLRVHMWNICY